MALVQPPQSPISTNFEDNQVVVFIPYAVENTDIANHVENKLFEIMKQAEDKKLVLKIVKLKKDLFNLGQDYFDSFDFEQENESLYETEIYKPSKGRGRAKGSKNAPKPPSPTVHPPHPLPSQQNLAHTEMAPPLILQNPDPQPVFLPAEAMAPQEPIWQPPPGPPPLFPNCYHHILPNPFYSQPAFYPQDFEQPGSSNFNPVQQDHKIPDHGIAESEISNVKEHQNEAEIPKSSSKPADLETKNPHSKKEPKSFLVNRKQYARILKRREQRQKLMEQGLLPKTRKKYLHESRHRHAVMRNRNEGGQFNVGQTRVKLQALKNLEERRKREKNKLGKSGNPAE